MRTPPLILIVDDDPALRELYQTCLGGLGYEILTAADGEQALAAAGERHPDLILLDLVMPGLDGLEVCRRLKGDASVPFIPIILNTGSAMDVSDVVAGLDAGADEYLTKPVDSAALVARVRSMLRSKALHDTVQRQTAELANWNRTLEQRVKDQVAQMERLERLRGFLPPRVADLIVSSGSERFLEDHRREIAVVFCDLRGFSAFSEGAEPEEVMDVLREYHGAMGPLILESEATIEHYAGDGIMIFFNDPLPCADPAARAVRLAVEMRRAVEGEILRWRRRGQRLGFGVGIAFGYATLGLVGCDGGRHYAAIGSIANLAARLCDDARGGQILVSERVYGEVEHLVEAEDLGQRTFKGFSRPLSVYNIMSMKTDGP